MNKTDEILVAVARNPGALSGEVWKACTQIDSSAEVCQLLLYLYREQKVDRIRAKDGFRYFLPGQRPEWLKEGEAPPAAETAPPARQQAPRKAAAPSRKPETTATRETRVATAATMRTGRARWRLA